MTFEQPAPMKESAPSFTRPLTSISMARTSIWSTSNITTTEDRPRKLARRPRTPSHSSVFGRPWTSQAPAPRPRISAPTNFRRLSDPLRTERKPNFRKLELSIYLADGRLSPLPDFSVWDETPNGLAMPKPAQLKPESSVDEPIAMPEVPTRSFSVRRKPVSVSNGIVPSTQREIMAVVSPTESIMESPCLTLRREEWSNSLPGLASVSEASPWTQTREDYLITLPTRHRSSSAPRPSTSHTPMRVRSPEPPVSMTHRRSQTETIRTRRSKTAETIDDAIRELNTIVEERRASALKRNSGNETSDASTSSLAIAPASPPQHHVPAIAPAMRVRARSETLTDIGSAFSIPLQTTTPAHNSNFKSLIGPPQAMSSITAPPAAVIKTAISSPTHRLKGWIKRSMNAPNTNGRDSVSPASTATAISAPFYQCASTGGEQYSNISSPALSSISTLTDGDSETSPTESYPTTDATALSTPLGFGFGGPQKFEASIEETEIASRPSMSTSTTSSSFSKRMLHRMSNHLPTSTSRRGVSVDTTHTVSSVGTSILGENARGEKGFDNVAPPPKAVRTSVGVAF
jgi:hypothetical protein